MANPATCATNVLIFNKPAATTMTIIMLSSGDEAGCAGGGDCQNHIADLRLIDDRDGQTRPTPHRGPADRDLELNLTIEDSGYRRGAEIFETRFSRRRCRG